MKGYSRCVAAIFLVAVLSIQFAPAAAGGPRHGGDADYFLSKFARIIARLQKFIGVSTLDDQPLPPRP